MKKSIIFFVALTILILIAYILLKRPLMYDLSVYPKTKPTNTVDKGKLVKNIGLLADSHIDYQRLKKALEKAKNQNVDLVVHFGDLSDFGGFNELTSTKQVLDDSGIEYFVIPGDRDEVEGGVNFDKIFSSKVCTDQLTKFGVLCLSNPFNYTLIDDTYLNSFYNMLPSTKIIFSSQPIYNPNSNVYMGYFNKSVKQQADTILNKIKSTSVQYIISGDAHFFAKYSDDTIDYYNIGAITDKKNLQTPNFAILTIYQNGIEVRQVNID